MINRKSSAFLSEIGTFNGHRNKPLVGFLLFAGSKDSHNFSFAMSNMSWNFLLRPGKSTGNTTGPFPFRGYTEIFLLQTACIHSIAYSCQHSILVCYSDNIRASSLRNLCRQLDFPAMKLQITKNHNDSEELFILYNIVTEDRYIMFICT